jgi:hypothetical protein
MAQAARKERDTAGLIVPDLLSLCREALGAADRLKEAARGGVSALVMRGGKVDAAALEREQFAAHGFAWLVTYVEGLRSFWCGPSGSKAMDSSASWRRCYLQADLRRVPRPNGRRHRRCRRAKSSAPATWASATTRIHAFYTPAVLA